MDALINGWTALEKYDDFDVQIIVQKLLKFSWFFGMYFEQFGEKKKSEIAHPRPEKKLKRSFLVVSK